MGNFKRKLTAIVDLQFGSCGKGLLAGYLAKKNNPDTIAIAFAANAGHTFIDSAGNKMVTTMVPNGVVSGSVKTVLLGPGSVINPETLQEEIRKYIDPFGIDLFIHRNAAVITEGHRETERAGMVGIGSTMKGVGAASIQKIRRGVSDQNIARYALDNYPDLARRVVGIKQYNALMDCSKNLQVEGAQGFSLGINNGFYPYTTSRECTVSQLLSDCAVPFRDFEIEVVGACRTFPIRVANRYDETGKEIGWSGPNYEDQKEIDWSVIGVAPELTTVTKLPRRLFTFSMEQVCQAVRMNGVDNIFLNFANYLGSEKTDVLIEEIENATGIPALVRYVGWGAREDDIEDRG